MPTSDRTRRTFRCSSCRAWFEGLYAADFDHLQRLYERLNTDGEVVGSVTCPECSSAFEVDLSEIEDGRLGE